MQGEEVAKVDDFEYMGPTVQSNGEYGREGWNEWRRMSGEYQLEGVQCGSQTSNVIRAGDGGTDEKTRGGAGGGRVGDVKIFVRSDKNGQYYQE